MAIVSRLSVERAKSVKKAVKKGLSQRLLGALAGDSSGSESASESGGEEDSTESDEEEEGTGGTRSRGGSPETVTGGEGKEGSDNVTGTTTVDVDGSSSSDKEKEKEKGSKEKDKETHSKVRFKSGFKRRRRRGDRKNKDKSKQKRRRGSSASASKEPDLEKGDPHAESQRVSGTGTGVVRKSMGATGAREQHMPADAVLSKEGAAEYLASQGVDPAIMPMGIITLEDVLEGEFFLSFQCFLIFFPTIHIKSNFTKQTK